MNSYSGYPLESETSLWLQNLVYGQSGLLIKAKQSVFCGSSPFQKVEVFDTYSFGLVLCLGGTVVLTERDYEPYHEMIVHPAMMTQADPQNICIIGGGDGGCLREVLKYPSVKRVIVVEIDSLVKETVENYIPAFATGFSDPRTEVVINDGYEYLKEAKQKFDLIVVDSYDPGGPVRSLETADFFNNAAAALTPQGIAVLQTDSPVIKADMIRQIITDTSASFKLRRSYICYLRTFPAGICSFLMVCNEEGSLDGFNSELYEQIAETCAYYNKEIHTGAFCLPENIRKVLEP
ncbi:MAG: polyamine aminopropyltransferase [Chitinispirillales bacterium]|jgi:spermidine synthase|nr:polyamine aminopropyltransferase [Chitinispirillales bacterium]